MPDENPTPGENLTRGDRSFGDMERDALYLLTDPGRQPPLWSVPDIGRELAYFDPECVITPLLRVGLIYKTSDGFVFATPAAYHLVGLVGHVA
ncbi:MAG TPA: hypothetical protein VK252_01125 [Solirubrobacteraceae bacterium]|nr:hypothetical protein [Solirubrobacteraceae bacterium]